MARARKTPEAPAAPLGLTVTVERPALLAALHAVIKTVETKSPIMGLTHLKLTATTGGFSISGTDHQIETVAHLQMEIEATGTLTVPAGKFVEIVREAPDTAQIRIEQAANLTTVIRAGRSRFVLPGLDPETYPAMPLPAEDDPAAATRFEIEGARLASAFSQVDYSISTEETRFYLNGVFLHTDPDTGNLILCATDGLRLARFDLGEVEGVAGLPPAIIPRKTVDMIVRLAEIAGETAMRIAVSRHLIRVEAGDVALISRLIDGTFPRYRDVIPKANPRRPRIATEEMRKAVKRVSLLTTNDNRTIVLNLSPGKLAVSVWTTDGSEASDEIAAEYEGDPLEIKMNSRLLGEVLDAADADTLQLELDQRDCPMVLRASDDAPALHVLMPMIK